MGVCGFAQEVITPCGANRPEGRLRKGAARLDTMFLQCPMRFIEKRHSTGLRGGTGCKGLIPMDLSKGLSSEQCEKKRRGLRFYLAFPVSLGYNNDINGVEWGGRFTLTDVLLHGIGQAAITRFIALCEFRHYQCRFMRYLNLGEAAWYTGLPPSRSHHLAIFMRPARLPHEIHHGDTEDTEANGVEAGGRVAKW